MSELRQYIADTIFERTPALDVVWKQGTDFNKSKRLLCFEVVREKRSPALRHQSSFFKGFFEFLPKE